MSTTLSDKAVDLLQKAKQSICERHEQFEMDWYFQDKLHGPHLDTAPARGCGTAACIAGWMIYHLYGCRTVKDAEGFYSCDDDLNVDLGLGDIETERGDLSSL